MLKPEPVVNPPFLEFHRRVKSGAVLSLLINKPNAPEFDAFVELLQQRARQEYNRFAGLKDASIPPEMAANVFEEPPEFDTPGQKRQGVAGRPVNVDRIEQTIVMLRQYLDTTEIEGFLAALEALKASPADESCYQEFAMAFDQLGSRQGAVLTYAPYVGLLLADERFDSA